MKINRLPAYISGRIMMSIGYRRNRRLVKKSPICSDEVLNALKKLHLGLVEQYKEDFTKEFNEEETKKRLEELKNEFDKALETALFRQRVKAYLSKETPRIDIKKLQC